jgi:hypothetical protein
MNNTTSPAETSNATPPTVFPGLGYPANRNEISLTPTGWQASLVSNGNIDSIKVSRETF